MLLSTIIVDDEPLARKGLAIRIQEYENFNIIAQCCNGREALEAIRAYQPDVMFLDIQMPSINGFEVIEAIIADGLKMPIVVFVTAFDQYALKAFEVHALDYLLKPINEERFIQTITKIIDSIQSNEASAHKSKLVDLVSDVTGSDSKDILYALEHNQPVNLSNYADILPIKDAGEVSLVAVKNILWIEAAGDYMCVHTEQDTHILRKTMKELEVFLDPKQFIRNHRSSIVNKHYIDKFCSQSTGEYFLLLKNGKKLKVSRSYKDKVKQAVV